MKKLISLFILCTLTAAVNAQSLAIQLSKTNITCYNARNGSVNLTVSGGTTPYTFQWSTGATTEDISTLPPNYYAVTVTDAASNTATDGITITEPAQIIYQFTTSDYIVNGSHYNLSSYTWHNGSISTNVAGGVAPYTYLWSNGATTANISSLDAGSYRMTITDATSCTVLSDGIALTKPDRSDWTMTGNTNTDPSTQFIGTTDAQDLSFRSNNVERLRIKSNGQIKIGSTANVSSTGLDLLFMDANGILQVAPKACSQTSLFPWTLAGNSLSGPNSENFIGTCNNYDFIMYANGSEGMRIKTSGYVGIGTTTPGQKLEVNGTTKTTGLETSTLKMTTGATSGYVMQGDGSGNASWVVPSLGNHTASQNIKLNGHWLSNDGGDEGIRINDNGNVGIANSSPSEKLDITGNLKISGNIITTGSSSSLNVNDLHVENKIEVGNSIWLGGTNSNSTTNDIYTDDADLIINGNSSYNYNTVLNTNTGKVIIGTVSNPQAKLEVGGQLAMNDNKLSFRNAGDSYHTAKYIQGEGLVFVENESIKFKLGGASDKLVYLTSEGKVIIDGGLGINYNTGSTYDYGLYVGKGILAEKVKVAVHTSGDWSDKVFDKKYHLRTLSDVETFIKEHHHLPNIPSAEEVVKSGIDLGQMDAKLLEKVEELTLYIIELKKEIEIIKKNKD
ncbi:MAG TPA: SprB repeat-containing protein [Bacteroidia bacterium]|nr:SprB repeat-containing protein [Bacteroidia bacterium]